MKFKLLTVISPTLFVLSATLAFAEHDASGEHPKEHKVKADADGDGKISYEEYRSTKEKYGAPI